jgi:ribosome biogenesis GTPase
VAPARAARCAALSAKRDAAQTGVPRQRRSARPPHGRTIDAMSFALDVPALSRIGWRPDDARGLPDPAPAGARVARVIAQHRSGYRAHDGHAEFPVQAPAALIRAGVDPRERPAVGDWVVLAPGRPPLIDALLPRRTLLVRAAAGERFQHQPIAANVDYVLVVCGLDGDYNPRRIERYLVLVQGSGALPIVVLTKRDLVPDADAKRDAIQRLAGARAQVHAVNAKAAETAALLAPFLGPGDTAVLVGSSGAGKSTLTNTLLGVEKQKTRAVREDDSRGRHTTTHRALIMLPSGGCLIDTPGMREIKLTGDEELAEGQFADLEALATECRFSDCKHLTEPGCRVLEAVERGTLDAGRLEHYRKLQAEIEAARGGRQALLKRKAEDRMLTKALGKRLTDKYGSR